MPTPPPRPTSHTPTPKSGDRRYTIYWHQCGQIRPYGPSIYDFTLVIEWVAYGKESEGFVPSPLSETLVDQIAKAAGRNFFTPSEKPNWNLPKLISRENPSTGVWRYKIEEEYTD